MKKGLITSAQSAELLRLLEIERHIEHLRREAGEIRKNIDPRVSALRVGDEIRKNGKKHKVEQVLFAFKEYGLTNTAGKASLEVEATVFAASGKKKPYDHTQTKIVARVEAPVNQLDKKIYGKTNSKNHK